MHFTSLNANVYDCAVIFSRYLQRAAIKTITVIYYTYNMYPVYPFASLCEHAHQQSRTGKKKGERKKNGHHHPKLLSSFMKLRKMLELEPFGSSFYAEP